MTNVLCRQDAYLKSCNATVTGLTDTGSTNTGSTSSGFITDQSVFYPLGGGQPGDKGWFEVSGQSFKIETSLKGPEPGQVLHVIPDGVMLPEIGAEIALKIDWEQRLRFMRVHTALHLLCRVVGAGVTGGQIGADKGRLDFDLETAPDKAALTQALNALIEQDHPISIESISDADLDANPELVRTMSVQPPRGSGTIRMVRIGGYETTVDYQPCGGTHLRSTAEIGRVQIGKIEKKGKQNRRINLLLID